MTNRRAPAAPSVLPMLETLPQSSTVESSLAEVWAAKAEALGAEWVEQHVPVLSGFDGNDMGALWAARKGLFHPYLDAGTVTRNKLLLNLPEPLEGRARRSQALLPMAQERYHAVLAERAGVPRADLLKKISSHQAKAGGDWLKGLPDDVVEENGKTYLVSYRFPSSNHFKDVSTGELPFYYAVELHHCLNVAQRAGVKVDGLRVYAFGADEWEGVERQVPLRPEMSAELVEVGTAFWNDFVLLGKGAPDIVINKAQTLEDLSLVVGGNEVTVPVIDLDQRGPQNEPLVVDGFALSMENIPRLQEHLAELGQEIFGHAALAKEADNMREMLTKTVQNALPMQALPVETQTARVDLGPVRLKIDWAFNPDNVESAIRGAMALKGQSDEEIDRWLEAENFYIPATYSPEALVVLLREKKGIDVHTDPDLQEALVQERRRRPDTLLAFLKDLAGEKSVDWTQLVDYDRSKLSVELVRTPTAGFGKELREDTNRQLRQALVPVVRQVAKEHVRKAREHAALEASNPTAPKPKRRPRP